MDRGTSSCMLVLLMVLTNEKVITILNIRLEWFKQYKFFNYWVKNKIVGLFQTRFSYAWLGCGYETKQNKTVNKTKPQRTKQSKTEPEKGKQWRITIMICIDYPLYHIFKGYYIKKYQYCLEISCLSIIS